MLVARELPLLAAAVLLPLLATPAAAADPDPVPRALGGLVAASHAGTAARAALAADPTAAHVTLRQANPGAVRPTADRLELDLGAGRPVRLRRDWSAPTTDGGGLVWAGRVGAGDDAATLVRRGDGLTGSVRVGPDLYRIQPVAGVGHAAIRVAEDALPPEHPAGAPDAVPTPFTLAPQSATVGANTTIRVLAAASKAAIAGHSGDFKSLVELAVAETNQSYRSGEIAIDLELAGYVPTDYADTGKVSTDLSALKGKGDGRLDDLHTTRDEMRADVVALIVDNADACGVAPGLDVNADAAFVVVSRTCATGYYSFGHEIGHLQGASHDKAQGTNSKYAHGHGYTRDGQWRTIMAYECPKKCKRVQHWSNPRKQYESEPLGTAATEDNARVLNQTAARIGAFRP